MERVWFTKILKVFVILICLTIVLSNFTVFAYDITGTFNGTITTDGDATAKVKTILATVLDVVRLVGAGVALIILMYIGAKFMMAAPSERANIKQYSMNYVVGAFILLGASGILSFVKTFAQNITATGG